MPFFSILIPVYNVEDYIEECLNSIISQTFNDYEVIMLNDGSTDSSAYICQKYVDSDERFRLIHQDNRGLLQTRRRLYQEMKGRFAVCLDGDDYKPLDSLKKCYDLIQKYDCDMLIGRLCEVSNEGNYLGESKQLFNNEELFIKENKQEILECFCSTGLMNSLVIKIVRKDIIDIYADYSEYVDVKGEDMLQSMALLKNANRILYTSHIMYYYRSSINSRTNNFKMKYIRDLNLIYFNLLEFCIDNCNENVLGDLIHQYLYKQRYMLGLALPIKERKIWEELQKEMCQSQMIKLCKKYINKRYNTLNDKIILWCISGENNNLFRSYILIYFWTKKFVQWIRKK